MFPRAGRGRRVPGFVFLFRPGILVPVGFVVPARFASRLAPFFARSSARTRRAERRTSAIISRLIVHLRTARVVVVVVVVVAGGSRLVRRLLPRSPLSPSLPRVSPTPRAGPGRGRARVRPRVRVGTERGSSIGAFLMELHRSIDRASRARLFAIVLARRVQPPAGPYARPSSVLSTGTSRHCRVVAALTQRRAAHAQLLQLGQELERLDVPEIFEGVPGEVQDVRRRAHPANARLGKAVISFRASRTRAARRIAPRRFPRFSACCGSATAYSG